MSTAEIDTGPIEERSFTATGEVDPAHSAFHLRGGSGRAALELIRIGAITYIRNPDTGAPYVLPGGLADICNNGPSSNSLAQACASPIVTPTRPWVLMPTISTNPSTTSREEPPPAAFLVLVGLGGEDPAAGLSTLRGVIDAHQVGQEVVRGISARHFRAGVDIRLALETYIERATAKARSNLTRSLDLYVRHGGTVIVPTDVWIDGVGRVRRVVFKATVPDYPSSGTASHLHTLTEFFDFGAAVNIVPPPADQVAQPRTSGAP